MTKAMFVGVTYAGWRTRQENLERNITKDGRLDATFRRVTGWREGGLLERAFPGPVAGRLRALGEARAFAALPRPDVVWTSCSELAFPYLWSFFGALDRPLVIETDWTAEQQEAFAPLYFDRPARRGAAMKLLRSQERAVFSRVDMFLPMSRWAAEGLRRAGVDDERIRVLPPGIDLAAWRALPRNALEERPLRLLFVGADFRRKGGDLLLNAVRGPLAGRCEADIVTRDETVKPGAGVRVHRLEPNSPELRALYAAADIFVLPTRAECFGIVLVEALASGLPAIAGDVGGTSDIVDDGESGWLIRPDEASLVAALEHAFANRHVLAAMGQHGRRVAEERFDGARNDRVLADLMLELAARRRVARGKGAA